MQVSQKQRWTFRCLHFNLFCIILPSSFPSFIFPLSIKKKKYMIYWKFSSKYLHGTKICRTFALASLKNGATKKRSLNRLHKTVEVVQEASTHYKYIVWCLGRRYEPIQFRGLRAAHTSDASLSFSEQILSYNIYNGEFDPGSGWTLATGLTHASRGAAWT